MINRISKACLIAIFVSLLFSCNKGRFQIEPIDSESNSSLWSLKGMDKRLFDEKRRLQYFQLFNYAELKPSGLRDSLTMFINKQYPIKKIAAFNEVVFFFYEKPALSSHKDKVLLAARDSADGLIEGYGEDLVGEVWFSSLPGKGMVRRTLIFEGHKSVLDQRDTVDIGNVSAIRKITAGVAENNCLSVVDNTDELTLRRCYEVDFIQIRKVGEKLLSLSFISGKNAIDIDFHPAQGEWVSNELTFYGATSVNSKGVVHKQSVKLKNFDFADIAERF